MAAEGQGVDQFRKFPAEIRNQIYELVLTDDAILGERRYNEHYAEDHWQYEVYMVQEPIQVRCRYNRPHAHATRDRPDGRHSKCRDWREPAILRAAKWIRKEAAAIYYERAFNMSAHTGVIENACQWLIAVGECRDPSSQGAHPLELTVRSGTWDSIESWVSLAKCAQKTKSLSMHAWDTQINNALQEVFAIGLQARKEDWSEEWLEIVFEDWLEKRSQLYLVAANPRRGWEEVVKRKRLKRGETTWDDEKSTGGALRTPGRQRSGRKQLRAT